MGVPMPITAFEYRADSSRQHNGVGSSQTELAVVKSFSIRSFAGSGETNQHESYPGERQMKIITTWHCTEILEGDGREATPREWLILVGPGEDLIFEVKTTRQPTNQPVQSVTRH